MMRIDRRGALRSSLALLGAGTPANLAWAQTPARRWIVTGTASVRSTGNANPYTVLNNADVQALVLAALDAPLRRADVERRLATTDITLQNLLDTDVLRRRSDGRYGVAFNVMTRDDLLMLRAIAAPAGASLAEAFMAERAAFDADLAQYDLPHVSRNVIAMALLGCVVLDWDGLDITANRGERVPPVAKPNGDKYIMSMIESAPDISVRGLYWGSHSTASADNSVVFTTFGDHEAPRRLGFPDLTSRFNTDAFAADRGTPREVARSMAVALNSGMNAQRDAAGAIMMALRDGPRAEAGDAQETLRLLEALLYVRRVDGAYHAHVPVFTARDTPMLESVRARGRVIMARWLDANHARIRQELSGLSSIRAGVPYEIVFTQVWHDLFGWANNYLARQGFLYDPYGPNAEWVSFAPFVWERSLNLYAGTRIF